MGKIKALLKEIINLLGVYDQALLLQHQVKRFILGYYGDKNIDIKDINIFHITLNKIIRIIIKYCPLFVEISVVKTIFFH
jgi:hypothetical protein